MGIRHSSRWCGLRQRKGNSQSLYEAKKENIGSTKSMCQEQEVYNEL